MKVKRFIEFLTENLDTSTIDQKIELIDGLLEVGIIDQREHTERIQPLWAEIGRRIRAKMQDCSAQPLSREWLQQLAQDPELGHYADESLLIKHGIVDAYRLYSELVEILAQRIWPETGVWTDLETRTAPGGIEKPYIILRTGEGEGSIGSIQWLRLAAEHGPTLITGGKPQVWLEVFMQDQTGTQRSQRIKIIGIEESRPDIEATADEVIDLISKNKRG